MDWFFSPGNINAHGVKGGGRLGAAGAGLVSDERGVVVDSLGDSFSDTVGDTVGEPGHDRVGGDPIGDSACDSKRDGFGK